MYIAWNCTMYLNPTMLVEMLFIMRSGTAAAASAAASAASSASAAASAAASATGTDVNILMNLTKYMPHLSHCWLIYKPKRASHILKTQFQPVPFQMPYNGATSASLELYH